MPICVTMERCILAIENCVKSRFPYLPSSTATTVGFLPSRFCPEKTSLRYKQSSTGEKIHGFGKTRNVPIHRTSGKALYIAVVVGNSTLSQTRRRLVTGITIGVQATTTNTRLVVLRT